MPRIFFSLIFVWVGSFIFAQKTLLKNEIIGKDPTLSTIAIFPEYGDKGGGKVLEALGVIVCGNLRGPKARLLLTLLLPEVGKDPKV